MTMLPDVDEATWNDYQANEFQRKAKDEQDIFGFMRSAGDKMAQLQQFAGSAAADAGAAIDQQRAQLQQFISGNAPAVQAQPAQAPGMGYDPSALGRQQQQTSDLDSQISQLRDFVGQGAQSIAATAQPAA